MAPPYNDSINNLTDYDVSRKAYYVIIDSLHEFHDSYEDYHGYLATVVCVLGIIANGVNIVVLTRRSMLSPINCILTALAVSDGLTMAAYLPFALRFYVLYGVEPTSERNEQSAVRFLLFYARFSVVVHTSSIWLTVVMATFRYIVIRFPRYGVTWCTMQRAKIAILLVYIASVIVSVPNFTTITMESETLNDSNDSYDDQDQYLRQESDNAVRSSSDIDESGFSSGNFGASTAHDVRTESSSPPTTASMSTKILSAPALVSPSSVLWTVGFRRDSESERAMFVFNFWIQAIFVRLVPCVALTLLSALLVRTMRRAAESRRQLSSGRGSSSELPPAGRRRGTAWYRRWRQTNRTTRMLLTVVTLFLVTELPHSVANIMSGVIEHFVEDVYMKLGDVIDILALVNNGINFILYCTMSRQFRKTFVEMFRRSRRPIAGVSAPVAGGGRGGGGRRKLVVIDDQGGGTAELSPACDQLVAK